MDIGWENSHHSYLDRISTHFAVARGAGGCAQAASAGITVNPKLPPSLRQKRRGAFSRLIHENTTAS